MLRNIDLGKIDEVKAQLFDFIWDFKHGDNVLYNFQILSTLYQVRTGISNPEILNKPITVQIVSIIEAIFNDFLARIHGATYHLPATVDRATLRLLKVDIQKSVKQKNIAPGVLVFRRKLYQYSELVSLFKKHHLLGPDTDPIYSLLEQFGEMRNRVHIDNYFRNLEQEESIVFTDARLASLEDVLSTLWRKFTTDFRRPWPKIKKAYPSLPILMRQKNV